MEKSKTLARETLSVISYLEGVHSDVTAGKTTVYDAISDLTTLLHSEQTRLIKNLATSIVASKTTDPQDIRAGKGN